MTHPSRSVDVTLVQEWDQGQVRRVQDYLVGEEPLEIRVRNLPLTVTMRTPGYDLELAEGFLFTEGFIQQHNQIISIGHAEGCKDTERGNIVQVATRRGNCAGPGADAAQFFCRFELWHLWQSFDRFRSRAGSAAFPLEFARRS